MMHNLDSAHTNLLNNYIDYWGLEEIRLSPS